MALEYKSVIFVKFAFFFNLVVFLTFSFEREIMLVLNKLNQHLKVESIIGYLIFRT